MQLLLLNTLDRGLRKLIEAGGVRQKEFIQYIKETLKEIRE